MIAWMLSVVKAIDGTGSTQLILAALVPGLLLAFVWPRRRRLTSVWFVAAAIALLLLSVPVVANALAAPLATRPAAYAEAPGSLDALVIFDGDNRRGRLRAAKALLDARSPAVVWVLGVEPDWFRQELPPEGIPVDLARYDTSTTTTREQVAWVERYRANDPAARIAIVVSRVQTARVAGIASAMRVSDVQIIGADTNREPAVSGLSQFVPSGVAWRVSRDALYEHAALAYYARNGWIAR